MNDDITNRIKIVIDHYGLSVTSLAESIGVQRSSISHILNGRNRPSLDFVMKLVKTYPEVNLYWLLIGKGHFPSTPEFNSSPSLPKGIIGEPNSSSETKKDSEPIRMVVFYSDGTFESFDAKKS